MKRSLLFLSVLAVLLALTGCAGGPGNKPGDSALKLSTSVPMRALNAMYNSRTAMIQLAEGTAEDPQAAYAEMVGALPALREFNERIEALSGSFNDADYLRFWDQLASFGSLYQINTGGLKAERLRQLELNLRSFETDVHVLERVYGDYMDLVENLHEVVDAKGDPSILQNRVPLVNAITQKTIELDVMIKDFSDDLFGISRSLRSMI